MFPWDLDFAIFLREFPRTGSSISDVAHCIFNRHVLSEELRQYFVTHHFHNGRFNSKFVNNELVFDLSSKEEKMQTSKSNFSTEVVQQ